MAEATTAAAFLYAEDIIDEEKVLSVVQSETERTTPLFPYLTYKRFTLNDVTDDKIVADFRFYKGDITRLVRAFHLPRNLFATMELQLQQKKDYVRSYGDLPMHVAIVTSSHDSEEVNLNFA